MSGGRLAAIGGAGLVVALCAGFLLMRGGDDSGPQVPTHRVSKSSFRRAVPADGNLKAVQATPITAPQEARMPLKVAWMVEDGDRVEAGQVVMRFDPSEMKDRLRDGRDNTAQARKRISKESVTAAATRRKRDREAAVAELEMRAAEQFAYADNDVFSRNEIIESQIDRELASAKMDHAHAAKGIERSVTAGKLDVLKVQERQAELEVTRAEKAMGLLEVTAPHSGLLLIHRDWRGRTVSVGDTVWPGMKIAEVPQDEAMEAEVFVLEADGGALEVGMKATVVIESQPGTEYQAEIKRVDTLAQPRIQEVPVQYFAVVLSLAETDQKVMKIGQRVRATILLEESEAIAVPRQAVFIRGSKSFVFKRVGDGFERVEVELGAGTAGRVTVTSGLTEGDEIALREPGQVGGDDAGVGGAEATP